MGYKKNADGSYTCSRLMKYDGTVLEVSSFDLDEAQQLLKKEIADYRKGYTLVKTTKQFKSPGKEGGVDYVYARIDLADIIDKEVKEEAASGKTPV